MNTQRKEGGFRTKVRSYDFDSGRLETVVDPFETQNTEAWLKDTDGNEALVQVTFGGMLAQWTILEMRTMAGDAVTITEFPGDSLPNPWSYWPEPRLIGDFVVWTDTQTADFLIYDRQTRSIQRFNPADMVEED